MVVCNCQRGTSSRSTHSNHLREGSNPCFPCYKASAQKISYHVSQNASMQALMKLCSITAGNSNWPAMTQLNQCNINRRTHVRRFMFRKNQTTNHVKNIVLCLARSCQLNSVCHVGQRKSHKRLKNTLSSPQEKICQIISIKIISNDYNWRQTFVTYLKDAGMSDAENCRGQNERIKVMYVDNRGGSSPPLAT